MYNPDYRNNPSLLIRLAEPAESSSTEGNKLPPAYRNYIIDAGKTFRESILRWGPRLEPPLKSIDAIILTHEHADAMLGLDDVRGLQDPTSDRAMPIYLSSNTMSRVRETFNYLVPKDEIVSKEQEKRFVARLAFHEIYRMEQRSSDQAAKKIGGEIYLPDFELPGSRALNVKVLPLIHGEDCICLGFSFGDKQRVVYLSDMSRAPELTMKALLEESARGIDILVLDCLQINSHNTHLNLEKSLELVRILRPKKTYFVGMSCDTFPPHNQMNDFLASSADCKGLDVQLARDGLVVDVEL